LVNYGVCVIRPIAGQTVTQSNFMDVFNMSLTEFVIRKEILGDSSDKIPGVYGVGVKTVDKVVSAMNHSVFSNRDTALDHMKDVCKELIDDFRIKRLHDGFHVIHRNHELMDFTCTDVNNLISVACSSLLPLPMVNPSMVRSSFTALGFNTILNGFDSWIKPFTHMNG